MLSHLRREVSKDSWNRRGVIQANIATGASNSTMWGAEALQLLLAVSANDRDCHDRRFRLV